MSGNFNVATHDQPEYIEGRLNTPGLYHMLGYPFALGRDFLPEEGQPGKDHVVSPTNTGCDAAEIPTYSAPP